MAPKKKKEVKVTKAQFKASIKLIFDGIEKSGHDCGNCPFDDYGRCPFEICPANDWDDNKIINTYDLLVAMDTPYHFYLKDGNDNKVTRVYITKKKYTNRM